MLESQVLSVRCGCDLMTYLTENCGPKRYVDQEMQCGEYELRACQCGGSTQNSFAVLLGKLGSAPPLIFLDRFQAQSAESEGGLFRVNDHSSGQWLQ